MQPRGRVHVDGICKLGLIVPLALLGAPALAQTTIEKQPDLGRYWHSLSPTGGSYVYADCFVAPAGVEFRPQSLGTWLLDNIPGGAAPPTVRFEIWGNAQGVPDPGNILATTGSIAPAPQGLAFTEAAVLSGAQPLNAGERYWFAATVVGEAGQGGYTVGGHSQNRGYLDNCYFAYSNDPAGINFDGVGGTPEMAFAATFDESIPIQCQDVQSFRTGCPSDANGHVLLVARVSATDPDIDTGAVEIAVDGLRRVIPIEDGEARMFRPGPRSGQLTLEVTVPAGCFPAQVVTCP